MHCWSVLNLKRRKKLWRWFVNIPWKVLVEDLLRWRPPGPSSVSIQGQSFLNAQKFCRYFVFETKSKSCNCSSPSICLMFSFYEPVFQKLQISLWKKCVYTKSIVIQYVFWHLKSIWGSLLFIRYWFYMFLCSNLAFIYKINICVLFVTLPQLIAPMDTFVLSIYIYIYI